jgi:GNAT superfamily N-acetyltransferase
MNTITLPENLLVRAATRDDAQAIADMNREYERAEYGEAETIVDDVFEFWDWEQMDLSSNTCAITTQNGELIGYTGVAAQRSRIVLDAHTFVHPTYRDLVIGAYLLQFAEQRAKVLYEANPALPHSLYAWGFTAMTKELLKRHGYVVDHSDYTMKIQFDEAPAAPELLQGITIRPFIPGQEERAVYEVIAEAFPDIDGKPYRPYDEWYENVFKKSSSFEPSMLYVAIAEHQVVGTTLCRIYPEVQDGYIWQVAVRRAWRKHGIALQLLRTAFREFYRRGIRHVELGVNSQNATGAHELYARAGMHKRSQVDTMVKTLS